MIGIKLAVINTKNTNMMDGIEGPGAGEMKKAKHDTELIPDLKKWSDINIARFLSVYKAHPILWDPRHSFYNDQRRRMKAYGIIARRLNLFGVGEKECIELVKSLRSIYATEKRRREAVAEKCNRKKYTPCWYRSLEELIGCVKKRLREASDDEEEAEKVKEADFEKPWEKCCPKLYREDIWTPEHFGTDITSWFLGPEVEEEPLCTCPEVEISQTTSEDVCHAEILSINKSSNGTVRCTARGSSSSSSSSSHADECCFDVRNNSRFLKKRGEDVRDEEAENCCEEKLNEIETTHIHCCDTPKSDHHKIIEETIQCPLENAESQSAEKICADERSSPEKLNFRPCGTEAFFKFCSASYAGRGSVDLSLKSQASVQGSSIDCCHSHCHPDSKSDSLTSTSDRSSLSRLKSRSLAQEDDGSARTRLNFQPDPTRCEKCAAERVKIVKPKGRTFVSDEDPRMLDLDKFCRYKDWDKIYNIRTQITSDKEIAISKEANKKSMPIPMEENERSRRNSQNDFPSETDGLVFADPNSSDVRRVSLIDEYNREYGLNIPIDQRKHFTCEDSENFVYRSAQLIL